MRGSNNSHHPSGSSGRETRRSRKPASRNRRGEAGAEKPAKCPHRHPHGPGSPRYGVAPPPRGAPPPGVPHAGASSAGLAAPPPAAPPRPAPPLPYAVARGGRRPPPAQWRGCRVSDVKPRSGSSCPRPAAHYTIRRGIRCSCCSPRRQGGREAARRGGAGRTARPDSFLWGAGHGGAARLQAEQAGPGGGADNGFHLRGWPEPERPAAAERTSPRAGSGGGGGPAGARAAA